MDHFKEDGTFVRGYTRWVQVPKKRAAAKKTKPKVKKTKKTAKVVPKDDHYIEDRKLAAKLQCHENIAYHERVMALMKQKK